ncbi:restriction endonuclease subunit S [Pasteurella multocida]|uniref:restriction endonuclease subunit S n=1 Tax=Pasteurella multocida TaxID=747 RepID=UPI003CE73929
MGDIVYAINGDRGKNYPSKDKLFNSGIPFVSAINLVNGTVSGDKLHYLSQNQYNLLGSGKLEKNDLIFCLRGSLGKNAIYPFNNGAIASSLIILRNFSNLLELMYLYYYINSPLIVDEINKYNNGTAQPNLSASNLEDFFCPLPPRAEQKRIVAKIEELLPFVEQYAKKEQELTALHQSFPSQLKKSILQAAIQGKLVEQNPQDESSMTLITRIQAEKERLISEKKLKKPKQQKQIFRRDNSHYELIDGVERCIDEELPFEIPDSWCWVRCGDYLDVRDGTHDTPKYILNGYPLITSKNLIDGKLNFENVKYISKEDYFKISERSKVEINNILFAMIGSIGNPVIVRDHLEFSIKNVALFKPYTDQTNMDYIFYLLLFYQMEMKNNSSGGVQSFVSLSFLRDFIIPIPPLAEQKRIVEELEVLFSVLQKLEKN